MPLTVDNLNFNPIILCDTDYMYTSRLKKKNDAFATNPYHIA